MKLWIIALLAVLVACATPVPRGMGTQDLTLNESAIESLGLRTGGVGCYTEEYKTGEFSPLAQYSFCNFTLSNVNDTEVVLEVHKFTNEHDRNGSYQYQSLHLRGLQGLISENDLGDLSRFYVNNESTVYYYHLWIAKDAFLIHLTSKGSQDVDDAILNLGTLLLSRFEE